MPIRPALLRIDARIPVRFGSFAEAGAEDAVLSEGRCAPTPRPAKSFNAKVGVEAVHAAGCLCCLPRNGAAQALADLFMHRAKGTAEFRSVLAVTESEEGRDAVLHALRSDPVASARFRLEQQTPPR